MKKKEPKASPQEASTVSRSIKMPAELDTKLAALAKAEDRSWSYIVVRAVREMFERAEKP